MEKSLIRESSKVWSSIIIRLGIVITINKCKCRKLYMLNSYKSSGSWSDMRRYFRPPLTFGKDIFNETSTRRFLPTMAKNGQISIGIITDSSFRGYYYDKNHPNKNLQDCVSATIYIQNTLNVRSQTIGGD